MKINSRRRARTNSEKPGILGNILRVSKVKKRPVAQLLPTVSKHLLQGAVRLHQPPIQAGDADPNRRALKDPLETQLALLQSPFRPLMLNRHANQVGSGLDRAQLRFGRRPGLAVVHGEGAHHLATPGENRFRPTGTQAVLEAEAAQAFPAGIGGDVFHDHPLPGVAGCATRPHLRANLQTFDRIHVCFWQAGRCADVQVSPVRIQQQDQPQHPWPLLFQQAHQSVQNVQKTTPGRQQLQKLALSFFHRQGALMCQGIHNHFAHNPQQRHIIFGPVTLVPDGIKPDQPDGLPLVHHWNADQGLD